MRYALLLSLAFLLACDAKPVTSPEEPLAPTGAGIDATAPADLEGLTDRQLLIALVTKVDALEARLDRESRLAHALIDSVRATPHWDGLLALTAMAAGAPPGDGTPPGGGGGGGGMALDIATILTRTELLVAQTDSMMDALYNPWAQHTLCFDLAAPLTFAAQLTDVGEAEVGGGVGVKVFGNGVKLDIRGRQELALSAALAVEPAFNYSACWDPGAHRAGTLTAGASMAAASATGPQREDLERAFNAMGLSPAVVSNTLETANSVLSGQLGFVDLPGLAESVWLPPAVHNLVRNPQAFTAGVQQAGEDALLRLCDTSLYPADVRDVVAEACALQLPSLQTLVTPIDLTPLETGFASLCTGFNGLLSESFKIPSTTLPSASISIPGVWSGTTFPGATIGGQTIQLFPQSPLDCSF